MHKRKIVVTAVAGALGTLGIGFAGAAFAQQSSVEIYGKLYPQFGSMSTSGATAVGTAVSTIQGVAGTGVNLRNRNNVDANNTRIGFRGKEDLGGGLKAFWQIENKVPIDAGAGVFAGRDSFAGIEGGFGSVRLGNLSTVYKTTGTPVGIIGVNSGNFVSESAVLAKTGFGTSSASSFHLRRANTVRYESPTFSGIQLTADYSPDEVKTGSLNADLWSLGAEYKAGPLSIGIAHEIHNDLFGGSKNVPAAVANVTTGAGDNHSKDKATRAAVMYKFGQTRVALDLTTTNLQESGTRVAGKFDNYKKTAWTIAWEQGWGGPWKTAASYSRAAAGSCTLTGGVACSTSGLDGNMLTLGGEYSLSKRTALFALYTKLNNGSSATYDNTAAGGVAPGADTTQYALGVRHNY